MTVKKRTTALTIAAIVAALAAAAYVDTAPYRTALGALNQEATVRAVEASTKDTADDMARFTTCSDLRRVDADAKELADQPALRACLLEALPKTKTAVGAIVMAMAASNWLIKHPGDEAIRQQALTAIENGRAELITAKSSYYDRLESMAEAHDRSFIMRLVDGRKDTGYLLTSHAHKLDQVEYSVLLPDVTLKQSQWLIKAMTNKL